jgi:hypothetical protein
MQSSVSIPIFIEAPAVDPRKARTGRTRRGRFGGLRVFFWSVILGMAIGTTVCVLEPDQSMRVSMQTRAALKTAIVKTRAFVADLQVR